MFRTTLSANPLSYAQACEAFGATDCTAIRAGSGSPSFVGFDIHRLPSGSFVPQHIAECGPACIEDGFCHSRFRELSRIHIADDDQTVFANQTSACDVQVMSSGIRDLRMYCFRPALIVCALRSAKGSFQRPVVPQSRNDGAVAARSQRGKPKINADFSIGHAFRRQHLTLQGDIPTTSRVLHKRARSELALNCARMPKTETPTAINNAVAINPHRFECDGYPTKRAFGAETGTETRASPLGISGYGKLTANCLHRIGIQFQFGATARGEIDKIKRRGPSVRFSSPTTTLPFSLRRDTEIPNLIAGFGISDEAVFSGRIFNAKFEGDEHGKDSKRSSDSRQGTGQAKP